MRALIGITGLEFKLFIRSFVNTFFVLGFPSMMLLLFGSIYGNSPLPGLNGSGTLDISVPAYSAMVIAVTAFMSLPLAIVTYREKKVLKRFRATPLRQIDLLGSQVIVNVVMTVVGMLLLLLLASLIFNVSVKGQFLQIALAFMLSIMSMFALGFVIAGLAPTTRAATALANLVYFPMIFLTGATLPLEIMPPALVQVSKILPLTYVVRLLKGVWLGGNISEYGLEIVILMIVLLISVGVATRTFRWE